MSLSRESLLLLAMWDGYIAEGKRRRLNMQAEELIRAATERALKDIEQAVRESTITGMATLLGKTFPGLSQDDVAAAIENVRLGILGTVPVG
jgi:hypothetical protein